MVVTGGGGAWQASPCDSDIALRTSFSISAYQYLSLCDTFLYQRSFLPVFLGTHFFLLSLMSTRTIFVLLSINLPNLAVSHVVGTLTFLLWMVRMTASFGFGKKVVSKAIKEVMLLWFGRKDNYGLGRGKGKGENNLYLERLIFWNPGWPRVSNYVSLGLRSF